MLLERLDDTFGLNNYLVVTNGFYLFPNSFRMVRLKITVEILLIDLSCSQALFVSSIINFVSSVNRPLNRHVHSWHTQV